VKSGERQPLIRVVASLESQFKDSLYDNSKWFVTTQGVLGEVYLAVDPGTSDRAVLKDGSVVRGISPPRLDLLLSETYELLHRAYVGISENQQKISDTFDDLHRTLKGTGDFFEHNSQKLDHAVDDLQAMTAETRDALQAARQKYVDNPQITRIMGNAENVSRTPLRGSSAAPRGRQEDGERSGQADVRARFRRTARALPRDHARRARSRRPRPGGGEGRERPRRARQARQGNGGRARDGRGPLRRHPGAAPRPEAQPVEVLLARVTH